MYLKLLILVGAISMLLGASFYVGSDGDLVYYNWGIQDDAFNVDENNCYPGNALGTGSTDATKVCYVPLGRTLVLERFGVVASDALDSGTEDCEIILETSSDGTQAAGTDISSSSIDVGDSNANAGKCGNVTIDGRGEYCFRTLDDSDANTTISGGGWWMVTMHAGSSGCGGACTCTQAQGLSLHVFGRLQ
jgi:hypothetical protein